MNMHLNIGPKSGIHHIISSEISKPQMLIVRCNQKIENLKVMVSNCEIRQNKYIQNGYNHIFDLTEYKDEHSIVVSLTNPNLKVIEVGISLISGQGNLSQSVDRYEAPLGKFTCPNDCESFLLSPGSLIQCPSCGNTNDIESLGYDD